MQAGSLVICVDTQGLTPDMPFNRLPMLGETYIVREMIPDTEGPPPLHPEGVALEGIIGERPLVQTWKGPQRMEYHFHAWRFRELLSPEELVLLEEVEETVEVSCLR